ncbi:ribonuclease III [Bacillota bacterium LX-D]|nr:ribonuclease III [Bacillota bacterium LX-D]
MESKRETALRLLLDKFEIKLSNIATLNVALTHPTYVFENKALRLEHNQRLEFLGDAVLGLVVGEYLYQHFPKKPEGELTKIRAAVVCEAALAKVASQLGLGQLLLLGRGEEISGGRERNSILADAFEAVLAAVYLEAGLDQARKLAITMLQKEIDNVAQGDYGDYKTALQEIIQKNFDENVSYVILSESGPDHNKSFLAGIMFQGELIAKGVGKSKKEAEQKAAYKALKKFM